jgi:hypothetical protein
MSYGGQLRERACGNPGALPGFLHLIAKPRRLAHRVSEEAASGSDAKEPKGGAESGGGTLNNTNSTAKVTLQSGSISGQLDY